MKLPLHALLFFFAMPLWSQTDSNRDFGKEPERGASLMEVPRLILKNGKEYKSVSIIRKVPSGITLAHEGGLATIDYKLLPYDVTEELGGFDEEAAKEYRIKQKQLSQEAERVFSSPYKSDVQLLEEKIIKIMNEVRRTEEEMRKSPGLTLFIDENDSEMHKKAQANNERHNHLSEKYSDMINKMGSEIYSLRTQIIEMHESRIEYHKKQMNMDFPPPLEK